MSACTYMYYSHFQAYYNLIAFPLNTNVYWHYSWVEQWTTQQLCPSYPCSKVTVLNWQLPSFWCTQVSILSLKRVDYLLASFITEFYEIFLPALKCWMSCYCFSSLFVYSLLLVSSLPTSTHTNLLTCWHNNNIVIIFLYVGYLSFESLDPTVRQFTCYFKLDAKPRDML